MSKLVYESVFLEPSNELESVKFKQCVTSIPSSFHSPLQMGIVMLLGKSSGETNWKYGSFWNLKLSSWLLTCVSVNCFGSWTEGLKLNPKSLIFKHPILEMSTFRVAKSRWVHLFRSKYLMPSEIWSMYNTLSEMLPSPKSVGILMVALYSDILIDLHCMVDKYGLKAQ